MNRATNSMTRDCLDSGGPLPPAAKWLLLLFVAIGVIGCGPRPDDPLRLGTETLRFEMPQRETTRVPGVRGRIALHLGDVETDLGVEDIEVIDRDDDSVVASSRLMRRRAVLPFEIDDTPYALELVEYDATHLFSDTATFALRLDR